MANGLQRRAKKPVTTVAGPYGHPFHPLLVTLPIGAWVASFVFDLISQGSGHPGTFAEGAYWLIGIGILGALLAAVFGLLDLLAIPRGTPALKTALTHLALNLTVVAAFTVSFFIRVSNDYVTVPVGLIVLSAVALAILTVSGWLGGKLTYRFGVRVVDEETQAEGFDRPAAA